MIGANLLVSQGTVRDWSNMYSRYFFKNADTFVDPNTFLPLFEEVLDAVLEKLDDRKK
jgi:hypothetical protein